MRLVKILKFQIRYLYAFNSVGRGKIFCLYILGNLFKYYVLFLLFFNKIKFEINKKIFITFFESFNKIKHR